MMTRWEKIPSITSNPTIIERDNPTRRGNTQDSSRKIFDRVESIIRESISTIAL